MTEPEKLVNPDDLGGDYLAHRTSAPTQRAGDDLIQRMEQRRLGQQAEQQPSAPAERGPVPRAGEPSRIARIGKDVAIGTFEAPRQVVGGATDAVHNAATAFDNLGNWLNENVADLRVPVPKTGVDVVDRFIEDPFKLIADVTGNVVDPAQTVTGGIVRDTARFLVGFIPMFRGAKAAGLSSIPAAAAAGGATEAITRDPTDENLSNLIDAHPSLKNPVTEFLAADPNDSEALARFKKGLEGAGLGLLTDGFVSGVRAIKAARAANRTTAEVVDELASARAKYGEVTDRDFMILGDPNKPLVEIRPKVTPAQKLDEAAMVRGEAPAQDAAAALANSGAKGGDEVFVNFAKVNTADDVKSVIGQMADAFKGKIDEATRGVQTNETTKKLADDLGMSVEDLLSRRRGQPLNAEEAVAARQLWASSAEKLLEAAKAASAPNAGAVDQFNFRRMMAIHYSVQAEVIGARTETARALQAWSIPVGGGVEKAKAIQELMESMGGAATSAEMAKRLAILEGTGATADAISAFVRRGWGATTMDAVKEVWVNGLLSNPKTHIVNVTSNTIAALTQIGERRVAEAISAGLREAGEGVAPGEAMAMLSALPSAAKDAFRLSWKALKTGETGAALGKVDLPREGGLSSRNIARELGTNPAAFEETGLGRAIDYLGTSFRVPSRLLGAQDEFFKTIGYRLELHAQSLRQATAEGLKGQALKERMWELVANPPEHIRINSADAALYSTFTNETGWVGKGIMAIRSYDSPLNILPFVMPFVRTPVNIARYAFERTPLAPLVGQWRADIAAGGARADLALARMATGSLVMMVAGDYAAQGFVSGRGPKDSGEREALERQGWQPYSIKMGDRWVSYNRLDPFGMTMGLAADIVESLKRGEIDDDDVDEWQEVVGMGIAAIGQVTISKTYLSGVAQFVEMMSDPQRYSGQYIDNLVGTFIPFASAMGAAKNVVDPVQREVNDPFEAVQARLIGLSDRLTPKRDLWGKEQRLESGFGPAYDAFSPVASKPAKDSPIDAEIQRLNAGVERIKKKGSFDGVNVNFRDNMDVYDEYVKLAGNELKHPAWGMGAKDYLDAVVSGRHPMSQVYDTMSDGKDGGKAAFIRKTIEDYRKLARDQIMQDPRFETFADQIREKQGDKQQLRLPVLR